MAQNASKKFTDLDHCRLILSDFSHWFQNKELISCYVWLVIWSDEVEWCWTQEDTFCWCWSRSWVSSSVPDYPVEHKCNGVNFCVQVSGESSGFLEIKQRYWRSQSFLRSHKSLLDLSWILWMMQDNSELYRPPINHTNTHEPPNPSRTCLLLHET